MRKTSNRSAALVSFPSHGGVARIYFTHGRSKSKKRGPRNRRRNEIRRRSHPRARAAAK